MGSILKGEDLLIKRLFVPSRLTLIKQGSQNEKDGVASHGPEVIKISMLNSAEHEICPVHKY